MTQTFDDSGSARLAKDFLGHLWPPFTQLQGLKGSPCSGGGWWSRCARSTNGFT
jgi:glycerol-3-phosphate acyltransferase PlsY